MALPFPFTSLYQFPIGIAAFLGSKDILELSTLNRSLCYQLQDIRYQQKWKVAKELVDYFDYLHDGKKTLQICKQYKKHHESNVRRLFYCLPEVFYYIQVERVVYLDLGYISDYGGYPEDPYRMITQDYDELKCITSNLLDLLSKNTTLIQCNLGLFEHLISREKVINAVEHHPCLDSVSMLSNGASNKWSNNPYMLWRNRIDGSFYWNSYRQQEHIN
jgi:hypothetical protein